MPDIDGPTHAYMGGSPGCWAAWGAFQARIYGAASGAAVQPLAVDAYAAQHPGRPERRADQSVWVHLASLCLVLERGGAPADGIWVKKRLLERPHAFERLDPPSAPRWLTIADLAPIDHPDALPDAVRRWAGSVWAAWAPDQPAVRALLDSLPRR